MFASRFFRRVFLPYLLLICAATGAVGLFSALRLRTTYLQKTEQALNSEARLVVRLLQDELAAGHSAAVAGRVTDLSRMLGCRITLIDGAGRIVADSEADASSSGPSAGRQELLDAAADGDDGRIHQTRLDGQDLFYLVHRVPTTGGSSNYLRLSVRLADLDAQLRILYGALAVVALSATGVAAVLCFYFASRQSAPVLELAAFAQALAQGHLNRRVLPSGNGEIGLLTTSLNSMADSLNTLLSQATKDRAELLTILESMSEGVIATDRRQNILLVNAKAADLLEFSHDGAQGKPLWEMVRSDAILKAAGEVLSGGDRKAFQISPAPGRHLEVTACTFPSEGTVEGLVIVAHDTSQSVRYQELRKEFVANVSHELRTPLTVIKGFTETLLDGAMRDETRGPKFLATIARHVDQLTNLVNDLLELSRLESSLELPRRSNVDVNAMVKKTADLLLPAAQKKTQTLTVETSGHLPRVPGNADYLERAVANLIDNAIKYTPEQGVVRVVTRTDGTAVIVEVSDNGIGIPPDDLMRVFERFYRVDRSRSRDMGGTGLGLSIVKHVAQAHGGTIEVVSTPGAGSTFRLRLPLPTHDFAEAFN